MFIQRFGTWIKRGAGVFHPTDLASCIRAFDGGIDAINAASGVHAVDTETVDTWTDQTLNADGTQTTNGDRPVMDSGSMNGSDSLIWDGSNTYMDLGSGSIISATGDFNLFFLVDADETNTTINAIFSQYIKVANNGAYLIQTRNTGSVSRYTITLESDGTQGDVNMNLDLNSPPYGPIIVEFYRSGNTFGGDLNEGGTTGSNVDAGTRSILQTGNALGVRTNSGTGYLDTPITGQWGGSIGAFFAFDARLIGTDHSDVVTYLKNTYIP